MRSFKGNYSDWRRTKTEEAEAAADARTAAQAAEKKAAREREEREARQRAAQASGGKSSGGKAKGDGGKATGGKKKGKGSGGGGGKVKNPYMFEKLEKRIMELEAKLEAAQAASATEEVFRDPGKLRDIQFEIAELENELATSYEEWENWETR